MAKDTLRIRTLQATDAKALLAFETENRAWFERHVDPRDPAFYSVQGITDHIAEYLSGFATGTWHPFVIEDAHGTLREETGMRVGMSVQSSVRGYSYPLPNPATTL